MARESGHSQRMTEAPSAEDVCAYLRKHPDFLAQHAGLIQYQTPPKVDRGSGVLDLQYYMVERLRADLDRLKDQQRDLLAASRTNLNGQNRIHAAVLFLLDAQSFEHLIQTITTDLAVLLDLDIACLIVESNGHDTPHVHTSGVRVVEHGTIGHWLGNRDVILRGDIDGALEIFGAGAGLVRSEALLRLTVSRETPVGLLAFGSREPDLFHGGQSTEQVRFLARVVERCIRSWLDLPA